MQDMKCLECGNTEKFYEPIIGYQVLTYNDGELYDVKVDNLERDSERVIFCAKCEGKVIE